ncbi:MAG: flagellin [Candidatus Eisenbacteria bacterium]|nr:flagellin [Candidatus Eisenbacteria bacterium]
MAINDITLAGGMRQNLASLQLVAALQARTTERLSTGKRVNSAVDDPSAYFAAQNHLSRASDLAGRKDAMGEAIQTVRAATEGIEAITDLIDQAKGLTASARGSTTADRQALAVQFNDLRNQIDALAGDAGYRGTNFLADDSLVVEFNEAGDSSLTITGFDATTGGDLAIDAAANDWATDADIDAAVTDLDAALGTLRTQAKTLAANLSVVTTRQEFTTNLITTLTTGADNLTSADQNEEGANMLALQTRQQLGIVALSLSSQAQQSILRLF